MDEEDDEEQDGVGDVEASPGAPHCLRPGHEPTEDATKGNSCPAGIAILTRLLHLVILSSFGQQPIPQMHNHFR